jgi:hypothetical protein
VIPVCILPTWQRVCPLPSTSLVRRDGLRTLDSLLTRSTKMTFGARGQARFFARCAPKAFSERFGGREMLLPCGCSLEIEWLKEMALSSETVEI